ncbi:4188_t:CDS:2, partial [Acaulospora morrowiae]
AVHFGINKSLISKWIGDLKSQLDNLKNYKSCHVGADRKEFFLVEEKQLFAWFLQMHESALAITYNSLKIEMLKIVTETFDMMGNLIVDTIGKKTIYICTTGKQWPKVKDVLSPPPNINISFYEKGWIDKEGMMT